MSNKFLNFIYNEHSPFFLFLFFFLIFFMFFLLFLTVFLWFFLRFLFLFFLSNWNKQIMNWSSKSQNNRKLITNIDLDISPLTCFTSSPHFTILTSCRGLLLASTGRASTWRTTSIPPTTCPKTTCTLQKCHFHKYTSVRVMKSDLLVEMRSRLCCTITQKLRTNDQGWPDRI